MTCSSEVQLAEPRLRQPQFCAQLLTVQVLGKRGDFYEVRLTLDRKISRLNIGSV